MMTTKSGTAGSDVPTAESADATAGDDLPAYAPPPYLLPPSLPERLAAVGRELLRTPTRAALTVVGALSLVTGLIALTPVTITASDSLGPYRAHCGIGYYVAGYPTAAIEQACHNAYGAHADVAFLSLLALLASGLALVALVAAQRPDLRPRSRRAIDWLRLQWSTPARAAAFSFRVVAGLVALVALRTVSVPTRDARGPLVAHCGITYYVFGTGDAPVQQACRAVYGARAAVFFLAVGLLVVSAAVVPRLLSRTSSPASRPARWGSSGRLT
jgi:hypothetical protein